MYKVMVVHPVCVSAIWSSLPALQVRVYNAGSEDYQWSEGLVSAVSLPLHV